MFFFHLNNLNNLLSKAQKMAFASGDLKLTKATKISGHLNWSEQEAWLVIMIWS